MKFIIPTFALCLLTFAAAAQTPPNAPGNLATTIVSTNQIDLSWTDNSNDEHYFIIYRSTNPNGPFIYMHDIVPGDTTNYSDFYLPESATNYYAVTAYNDLDGIESQLSNVATAILPNLVPAAPCCLEGSAEGQDVYMAWGDMSYGEDSFIVSRSLGPNGPFTDIAVVPRNVCYYVDYQVWDDCTIYYRVRSSNSAGDSAPTSVLQVHTDPY